MKSCCVLCFGEYSNCSASNRTIQDLLIVFCLYLTSKTQSLSPTIFKIVMCHTTLVKYIEVFFHYSWHASSQKNPLPYHLTDFTCDMTKTWKFHSGEFIEPVTVVQPGPNRALFCRVKTFSGPEINML